MDVRLRPLTLQGQVPLGILGDVPPATAENTIDLFRRVGALLEGHFRLSSGLHSSGYLQCALVLQHPREAETCGASVADRVRDLQRQEGRPHA